MNMQKNLKSARLSLPALLLSLAPAVGTAAETVGEAFDLNSNELLYREIHCLDAAGDSREVIYRNNRNELIARKRVDYRSGRTTPSFVQHNLYSSQTIKVELDDGMLTMKVLDAEKGEPIKVKSTETSGSLPVVIDAGFDEFVRAHWDELVAGGKKYFQFPFASRSTMVELRIGPLTCTYDSDTDQCFRLEMSNWLFRMLAAPIELGYDAESRRLTRYRGLSNIGDGNGNGLEVDIQYRYQDLPTQACAADVGKVNANQVRLDPASPGRDGSG